MKDVLGNELAVGDKVVFMQAGNYKLLVAGVVVSFTARMVDISYCGGRQGTQEYFVNILRAPEMVAKINQGTQNERQV